MTNFELKPCPFCGRELVEFSAKYDGGSVTELDVWCTCGAHITLQAARGSWFDAMKRWNTRNGYEK